MMYPKNKRPHCQLKHRFLHLSLSRLRRTCLFWMNTIWLPWRPKKTKITSLQSTAFHSEVFQSKIPLRILIATYLNGRFSRNFVCFRGSVGSEEVVGHGTNFILIALLPQTTLGLKTFEFSFSRLELGKTPRSHFFELPKTTLREF